MKNIKKKKKNFVYNRKNYKKIALNKNKNGYINTRDFYNKKPSPKSDHYKILKRILWFCCGALFLLLLALVFLFLLKKYSYTSDTNDKNKDLPETNVVGENEQIYIGAIELMMGGDYETSKIMFENISDYKDSKDYIVTIIFIEASGLIKNDPDTAVETLIGIKNYNANIADRVNIILYDKALEYMSLKLYEKAFYILENIAGYKDSDEMYEKYLKYDEALLKFNAGDFDSAYILFVELDDFSESENYAAYIEAGRFIKAGKYSEAVYYYSTVLYFLDSGDLYEKYAYVYYDEQFQSGFRDFVIPEKYADIWRKKRINDLNAAMNNTEESAEPAAITGTGIYIDRSFEKYGLDNLINYIYGDLPVFFLADSLEKVNYIMSFTGSVKYFGTYGDGSEAYATVVTATVKDTVTNEILFSKNYTAYPPSEGNLPQGDIHAQYDFLEKDDEGLSVYDKDIRPVLTQLFE